MEGALGNAIDIYRVTLPAPPKPFGQDPAEGCPAQNDEDGDGLIDSRELLLFTLLGVADSDFDGIKDGNDDANGNGRSDEDEDDDDGCPDRDSDRDGVDDEDEDTETQAAAREGRRTSHRPSSYLFESSAFLVLTRHAFVEPSSQTMTTTTTTTKR